VTLTVTDDDGATGTTSQAVTVTAPAAAPAPATSIALQARGYRVGGFPRVDLTWSGATATSVDVYRNGVRITQTANDRLHTDAIYTTAIATYRYKLCNAGTTTCSPEVSVTV
jgi:hypothetical protein